MNTRYKVTYNIKEDDISSNKYGYLETKTRKFINFSDVTAFIRMLRNESKIVGKPTIETT
jgi:hypothetical protein